MSSANLLPSGSSRLERAIASCMPLDRITAPIETLIDPWSCPARFLPWLAWQYRVLAWDETWSEQQQRQAVASSIPLHRRLGSPAAVASMLEILELDGRYQEWREYGGAPHQFRLTIQLAQQALPRARSLLLRDMLAQVRAKRTTPEIIMSVNSPSSGRRAATLRVGQHIVSTAFEPASLAFNEDSLVG